MKIIQIAHNFTTYSMLMPYLFEISFNKKPL